MRIFTVVCILLRVNSLLTVFGFTVYATICQIFLLTLHVSTLKGHHQVSLNTWSLISTDIFNINNSKQVKKVNDTQ
jgi:hypothetical protein